MSYDLNIVVMQQEQPAELPFDSKIEIINETQEELRYRDIWTHMVQTKGIWYYLGKSDGSLFDAYSICKVGSNLREQSIFIPNWIDAEYLKYNLVSLEIYKDYQNDFNTIIKYLIHQSPIKTIMLLVRFQGADKEIIFGVLKSDEFFTLLEKGEILFNVCYIISD